MAFQEMESFVGGSVSPMNLTLDWLLENNPDHAVAAVGKPAEFPSTQPIPIRKSRLNSAGCGFLALGMKKLSFLRRKASIKPGELHLRIS